MKFYHGNVMMDLIFGFSFIFYYIFQKGSNITFLCQNDGSILNVNDVVIPCQYMYVYRDLGTQKIIFFLWENFECIYGRF